MTQEINKETQGAIPGGFIPVTPPNEPETSADKGDEQYDKPWISQIPRVLKSLEENFSFTAVLVGIIGYIVISALGHMDSVNKYFGYISFLLISFLMYKLLGRNKIKVEADFKNINWFIFFGFIVMVGIFLIEHKIILMSASNFIISVFTKK